MKQYAKVLFLNKLNGREADKLYDYKVPGGMEVEAGDIVLVDTVFGVGLAQVIKFTDDPEKTPAKELMEVMTNKSVHLKKITVAFKQKDLRNEMIKAMAKADEKIKFKMYAEADPDFAKLLAEFEELEK